MKMNDFTEVSAIITHPDYTGKGYAKQLTAYVVNQIFTEKKFLFYMLLRVLLLQSNYMKNLVLLPEEK